MKPSLRTKFFLLILPLIGIELLLLVVIIIPNLQISSQLNQVNLDLAQQTQATLFTRLLNRQVKEYVEPALRGQNTNTQDLLDSQAEAQDALLPGQGFSAPRLQTP